jgi:hypothetical protein
MPRPTLLEEFREFHPDDVEQVNAILAHYEVEVTAELEESPAHWGFFWEYGGGMIAVQSTMSERQARAAMALDVYLYCLGVDVALCGRLGKAYVLRFEV